MPYQTVTTAPSTSATTATSANGCGCGCSSCTTCDSLQCLCRPRFFAGQLITDADFRRLDQYLVGKDRLHNKFLHGSGVVCGLEVVCNPCDDTVTVRPGYALGPCGEDIVICSDASVPVGTLIRDQRRAASKTNCPDPYGMPAGDCDALEQRWILGVCYDEQPGRPVATLSSSSSLCGCGGSSGGSSGSSSGGCGCGGKTTTASVPAGCEPTVICEGFRFVLTKAPPTTVKSREQQSKTTSVLAAHVTQCLTMLASNISAAPENPTVSEAVAYAYELKEDLRTIIATSNIHDCTLGQRLSAIALPTPNDADPLVLVKQAVQELLAITIDLFRECVCSALLPPCPEACTDDCIPLATLTVRSSDLNVLDICNWSSRKFAVTMPTLGYWLGWIPLGTALRNAISKLCCPPSKAANFKLDDKLHVSAAYAMQDAQPQMATHTVNLDAPASPEPAPAGAFEADTGAFEASTAVKGTSLLSMLPEEFRFAAEYVTNPSPLAGLDATVLQSIGFTAPDGAALASPSELNSPLAALALGRLLSPGGADLGAPLRELASVVAPHLATPGTDDRIASLEKALTSLQSTVASQAKTISELRSKVVDVHIETGAPAAKAAAKAAPAAKATVKTPPAKQQAVARSAKATKATKAVKKSTGGSQT